MILGNLVLFAISDRNLNRYEVEIRQVYEAKDAWNALQISLNEMMINWADGKTYIVFQEKDRELGKLIEAMQVASPLHLRSIPPILSERKKALQEVWLIARERLDAIHMVVEGPEFQSMAREARIQPGLQNLNRMWFEYLSSPATTGSRRILAVREVMEHIEYFPIYSETLNDLFDTIIEETRGYASDVEASRIWITLGYFLIFLVFYFLFAMYFSRSLSAPIIRISRNLSAFIGKEMQLSNHLTNDEILMLETSVDNLIKHYTSLSEMASRLAKGDIDSPILKLPEQGIVGRSLKDVVLYLKELAWASRGIRSGQYGAVVEPKSDKDILADNFNIMSRVIHEKITTLQNMFEIVEEGILVIDDTGRVIEANSRFTKLYCSGMGDNICLPGTNEKLFKDYDSFIEALLNRDEKIKDMFTELRTRKGHLIPVRVSARRLPAVKHHLEKVMLSFTDESWKSRLRREQKKLISQAMEAELRALRAQINPHFFFNTLNTITHLIETDSAEASKTVEKLSELFRYTLVSTRRRTVDLDEELRINRIYLDIEKQRFGERLKTTFRIDKACRTQLLPPMLLQPIIENAVKYGHDDQGCVHLFVDVEQHKNHMVIFVKDLGNRLVDTNTLLLTSGTGLRNVNQRLRTLYNRNLEFIQNSPSGLVVKISIPLESHR